MDFHWMLWLCVACTKQPTSVNAIEIASKCWSLHYSSHFSNAQASIVRTHCIKNNQSSPSDEITVALVKFIVLGCVLCSNSIIYGLIEVRRFISSECSLAMVACLADCWLMEFLVGHCAPGCLLWMTRAFMCDFCLHNNNKEAISEMPTSPPIGLASPMGNISIEPLCRAKRRRKMIERPKAVLDGWYWERNERQFVWILPREWHIRLAQRKVADLLTSLNLSKISIVC